MSTTKFVKNLVYSRLQKYWREDTRDYEVPFSIKEFEDELLFVINATLRRVKDDR